MEALNLFERDFDAEAEVARQRAESGEDRVFDLAEHNQLVEQAVEQARQEAYAQGHADGEAKKQGEVEQQTADTLEVMTPKLDAIVSDLSNHKSELERQMTDLAYGIVTKIAPVFVEELGPELIIRTISDKLERISTNEALVIHVAPAVKSAVASELEAKTSEEVAGSIEIRDDDALEGADVRIEWRNGFLEHRVSELVQEIADMIRPQEEPGAAEASDEQAENLEE